MKGEDARKKREESPKVVCVSHLKDVDGCVSSALVRCATRSRFFLTNYGDIKKCLRSIQESYDLVYFCDLGINETIIEEFSRIRRFAELTYIDHHPLDDDFSEALQEMGVEVVYDRRECASVLAFNLFQGSLPREAGLLASYAAFSDRLEDGPIARELIQKYDRDFVLFETMLLSYCLKRADVDLKSTFRTYIYMHNNKMFVLSYHDGLEQGEYYRSDTKEYTAMHYHPRDPGHKSYKELKIKPVSVDVPSKYREQRSTE